MYFVFNRQTWGKMKNASSFFTLRPTLHIFVLVINEDFEL